MKTRVKLGGNTKIRLGEKIAQQNQIQEGDVYDLDITPTQILMRKEGQQ